MKLFSFLAGLPLLLGSVPAATVILDFGNVGTGVWTEDEGPAIGRTYNAVTITGSALAVVRNNFYTSASLTDTTGALSGWGVSISKPATAGDIGPGGSWTGDIANATAPFANESADALSDGFFINNNGTITITFTGLNADSAYRLSAFGALTGPTTTPADFSLVTGTSASPPLQSLDVDTAPLTGVAANWLSVTPNASGEISLSVTASGGTSGRRTQLNAVRLEEIPEPGVAALGAVGGLSLLRRRRR